MNAAKWLSTTTLLSDLISGKDEGFESQGCRRGTQVYHLNGMRGEFGNTVDVSMFIDATDTSFAKLPKQRVLGPSNHLRMPPLSHSGPPDDDMW